MNSEWASRHHCLNSWDLRIIDLLCKESNRLRSPSYFPSSPRWWSSIRWWPCDGQWTIIVDLKQYVGNTKTPLYFPNTQLTCHQKNLFSFTKFTSVTENKYHVLAESLMLTYKQYSPISFNCHSGLFDNLKPAFFSLCDMAKGLIHFCLNLQQNHVRIPSSV